MALTNRPQFLDMDPGDALELLQRNHVGRLGFTFKDRVDIEPISYVYDDGYVYARTSPGTKLTVVKHSPWVAFQVDEVEGRYDWRSVVVHGTLYFLDAAGGDRDREAFDRATDLLRTIDAEALTSGDAAPFRTALFRIYADEIVGRIATTTA